MRTTLFRLAHHAPKYVRHAPPNPPNVSPLNKVIAKSIGAIGIFWILYRAKEDGLVMLGINHPWDH